MNYYLDITLLPDADISLYFLWEKVYQQVHLALVEAQHKQENTQSTIGVAFPEYHMDRFHLGSQLRLLASSAEALEQVNIKQWLLRLDDYVHIKSIREVPKRIEQYAYFKRLQVKSNNERLAKRKAKRKGITEEEAHTYFKDRKEVYTRAPFIRINSQSSGKRYRLFILRVDAEGHEAGAGFSGYGLSATSTVPMF